MDRFSLIVGLLLALLVGQADASYVSPSPPAGFAGGAGGGTFTPAAPTALEGLLERQPFARVPGPKIPGGPVASGAFRFGPGAARALAGAGARFLIPGVGAAMTAAWLASYCFSYEGGQWKRTCFVDEHGQPYTPPVSDGYLYFVAWSGQTTGAKATRQLACDAAPAMVKAAYAAAGRPDVVVGSAVLVSDAVCRVQQDGGTFDHSVFRGDASNCPAGWYVTPTGCVSSLDPVVVTPQQLEDEMANRPLPQQLPPGFPYPLDPQVPFVFNPDQATPPNAQPLRVPQGNPVPVPNTNPQQYRQPVTRFTPAPTPSDPFRLDARPEDLTGTSPTGMTEPQTVSSGSPPGDKPEQFDLCKEHPDIVACQVFKPDDLQPLPVPNENKNLAITPDSGWGASSASCPADKHASLSFGPIAFSYEPLCLFANGIRPMVIALAWFSAALTFFGFARKDS